MTFSRRTFVCVHVPILSRKAPSPRLISDIRPIQLRSREWKWQGANVCVALSQREKATDYQKLHALSQAATCVWLGKHFKRAPNWPARSRSKSSRRAFGWKSFLASGSGTRSSHSSATTISRCGRSRRSERQRSHAVRLITARESATRRRRISGWSWSYARLSACHDLDETF